MISSHLNRMIMRMINHLGQPDNKRITEFKHRLLRTAVTQHGKHLKCYVGATGLLTSDSMAEKMQIKNN